MSADYPHYENASDMARAATTVVVGRVVGSRTEVLDISQPLDSDDENVNAQAGEQIGNPVPADMAFTVYTIEIDQTLSRAGEFEVAGSELAVKIAGGEMSGSIYVEDGAPTLAVGDGQAYVFFLEEYVNGTPASPLNNDQAVLAVDTEGQSVSALGGADVPPRFLAQVEDLIERSSGG